MSLDPHALSADALINVPANDESPTAAAASHPTAAPSAEAPNAFAELGLAPEIVRAITRTGYDQPTEVQARAVPAALTGKDLLVSSQTGSGKTAAFVWPALTRILEARNDPTKRRAKGQAHGPRVLVLAPTRELAMQVSRAATTYGGGIPGLRVAHVVGGVPYQAQLKALRGPLDLLIATPGRLLDLMNSGAAILAQVELLVLDEADRMLDMGFIDDITAVAQALPEAHQTLMFSATFAGSVGGLAQQLTKQPQRISVDSHTDTHAQIVQRLHWADSANHKHALLEQLLTDREMDQCLVFTSTQQDADQLAYRLGEIGHSVAALHGGMPQGRRNRVLQGLRQGQLKVLVATDVAARGIDVPTITHVINYGLPMKAEDYVHRIGRTGRAGREGLAITLAERRDVGQIRRIERFTTQPITVAVVAGLEPQLPPPSAMGPKSGPGPRRGGFGGGGFGGGRPGGRFGGRPEQGFGFGRQAHGHAPHGGHGPHGGGGFEGGAPFGGGEHRGPAGRRPEGRMAEGFGPQHGDRTARGPAPRHPGAGPQGGHHNGPQGHGHGHGNTNGGFKSGRGGPARRGPAR